jgi:hypothetical protein
VTRQDIIIDVFKGLRREGYTVADACRGLAMLGVEPHELPAAVFISELHDTEYQQYFRRGEKAGRDAQRVMTETDLVITRFQVTRVADDLESAWYDAAYAKGFLKATEPPVWDGTWRRQPGVRRRRREW